MKTYFSVVIIDVLSLHDKLVSSKCLLQATIRICYTVPSRYVKTVTNYLTFNLTRRLKFSRFIRTQLILTLDSVQNETLIDFNDFKISNTMTIKNY